MNQLLQENLNSIQPFIQALYSDASLIASGNQVIATPERKKMAQDNIKTLLSKLNEISNQIGA